MEDDGELLAERQAADPQRDRSRGVLIDQGPAEQFVGEMVVHVPSISAVPLYRLLPTGRTSDSLRREMKLIYKPFGIILGILGGLLGKQLFDFVWTKIDDEEPPEATTQEARWGKILAHRGAPGHDLQGHARGRRPPGRQGLVLPHRVRGRARSARTRE